MRGKIIVFFVLEESMAHEYAKGFYASEAWHKCRLGYISHRRSVDGGLCEECHENLGYIVHHREHITPRTVNDPRVTLSWDNLEYVCKDCHDKIHVRLLPWIVVCIEAESLTDEFFCLPVHILLFSENSHWKGPTAEP